MSLFQANHLVGFDSQFCTTPDGTRAEGTAVISFGNRPGNRGVLRRDMLMIAPHK
jgi:hypothetical protein